jgi:hypothetical protein
MSLTTFHLFTLFAQLLITHRHMPRHLFRMSSAHGADTLQLSVIHLGIQLSRHRIFVQ